MTCHSQQQINVNKWKCVCTCGEFEFAPPMSGEIHGKSIHRNEKWGETRTISVSLAPPPHVPGKHLIRILSQLHRGWGSLSNSCFLLHRNHRLFPEMTIFHGMKRLIQIYISSDCKSSPPPCVILPHVALNPQRSTAIQQPLVQLESICATQCVAYFIFIQI